MIVPMKKVAILMQDKDADSTLHKLRSLGVLHVEHGQPPRGKDIAFIQEDLALITDVLAILSKPEFRVEALKPSDKKLDDWKVAAKHIVDSRNRLNQLEDYSRNLRSKISEWERWGDFNPEAIKALAQKNIYVRLYQIPSKEIKTLPSDVIVKKISSFGGLLNCAIISKGRIEVPFKEISLPKMSLDEMQLRLKEDMRVIDLIKNNICQCLSRQEEFLRIKKQLEKELEFQEALKGMGNVGAINYITGYIPFDKAEFLSGEAKKQRWGILITDPKDEDRVPTLIRNPRWVSLINPIFKVIEIIPGYRELDISLWFLVFLSIFFGMLIGDAGYGIILFALTFFAKRRWLDKVAEKSIFNLFYLFSLCAIIWGALTGTFFGQEWLHQFTKPLMPALRSDTNIQILCFLLGAIHLSIAHIWRAIRKMPSLMSLADIGWTFVLWGAFFLAKNLVLGYDFPPYARWFFIVGPAMVVFFTAPKRNILKSVGIGFGNLLLNVVNTFTDVVSYVRLFAVGLATVAVADSFNNMALGIGYNSFITASGTVLILLFGHALNILLGPMAVLVHGVRLNVLEFCNHVDIKWSGFAFRPLEEA